MAPTATVYSLEIDLSDNDRQVYEQFKMVAAMHPSETEEYLLTRVLAYCLEYCEGISFSKGLAEPEEPAVWAHSLDGQLILWVEIGLPGAEKLHKAAKTGARVAIYTHRDPRILMEQLAGKKIYRAENLPVFTFSGDLLRQLSEVLEKKMKLSISISERELYIDAGGRSLVASIEEHQLPG